MAAHFVATFFIMLETVRTLSKRFKAHRRLSTRSVTWVKAGVI